MADEIYWGMAYEQNFHSLGHLTTQVPVIVMTGFDKTYASPGYAIIVLGVGGHLLERSDPKGHGAFCIFGCENILMVF